AEGHARADWAGLFMRHPWLVGLDWERMTVLSRGHTAITACAKALADELETVIWLHAFNRFGMLGFTTRPTAQAATRSDEIIACARRHLKSARAIDLRLISLRQEAPPRGWQTIKSVLDTAEDEHASLLATLRKRLPNDPRINVLPQ